MDPVVAYFSSKVGTLKLFSLIIVSMVVGLSSYSHFNSHWSYHSRHIKAEERSERLVHAENDYEDCVQNRRIYPIVVESMQTHMQRLKRSLHPIESDLFDGEHHFDIGRSDRETRSGSTLTSATCPKPSLELILVSVSISLLIFSIITILWIHPELLEAFKIVDILVHVLSAFLLLLGSGMFFYSAYHISDWCYLKAKLRSSGYFVQNVLNSTGDITQGGEGATVTPFLNDVGIVPQNIGDHVALLPNSASHYNEACNLTHLTEEKYWTAAIAIISAIIYAAIAAFLIQSYRGNQNADGEKHGRSSKYSGGRGSEEDPGDEVEDFKGQRKQKFHEIEAGLDDLVSLRKYISLNKSM